MLSEIVSKVREYEKSLPALPKSEPFHPPLSSYLDCALHSPESTPAMVEELCSKAREQHYASVFVNPIYVTHARQYLDGSGVHVGTVAGFPLGGFPTRAKVAEAKIYLEMGADEIDMVISVGMLKTGEYQYVLEEIQQMAEVIHGKGGLLKVILEMVLLNRFEKIIGCLLARSAGADFVKTSTGFSSGGATVEDVELMRRVVGPPDVMGVKAAGGIHTLDDVMKMINAGANRLGTRLAAEILEEYQQSQSIR